MSPRIARRIRAGINRARQADAHGIPSGLYSTDDLEERAFKRTAQRYQWAHMLGWTTPLPPVPPRQIHPYRHMGPS